MKLRRVEIVGFKSFGKKTNLEFPEGISAIVGPNGSGKSNVIDAICFALGYPSRNLRAANAQELIHSGKRGNVTHAKVGLTFQEGDEYFEVNRKVDKTGKSTYKLNSATTSRDGIHDTLTKHSIPKNGFNIVMQNDVMRFIEIKPLERRKFLDQISGISGYEEKKKRSLDELGVVERRISDTNLILSEKKGYLKEIGKDREIAMKYQGMQDEYRKGKSIYLYGTLYNLENAAGKIDTRLGELSKEKDIKIIELARIDEEVDGFEQKMEGLTKKIITSSSGESGKIKGEIGALTSGIEKKQEEIQFLKSEIEDLEEKIKEHTTSQRDIKPRIKEKESDISKLRGEVEKIVKAIVAKEKERENKTKDYDNSELIALDQERKLLSESLFENKKSLTLMDNEIDGMGKKESELGESLGVKRATLKILESELGGMDKEISKLGAEAEKVEKMSIELENTRASLSELFQEFARVESEIKTIERMEAKIGESESLKFVTKNENRGYIGQIRELGTAPDKYKIALDIAAGSKSKCLVVKDDTSAQFYIEGLRKEKIGRATFLPLNKIRGPDTQPIKGDGIIGYAKDLIKCDKKYQNVFDFVFGETLVVKDIETARRLGIGKLKMVTLEGDFMARGGAMTGGYYQKAAMTFSSTEDKKKKLDDIRNEIIKLKDQKEKLERQLEDKDTVGVDVMREKKSNLSEKIESLRTIILEEEKEFGEIVPQKKELEAKKAESEKIVSKQDKEFAEIEKKMNMGAFTEMKEILQAIDGELHDLKDHRFELQTRENNIKNEIAGMKAKIGDLDKQSDEVGESISKFRKKIQENINLITEFGGKLQDLEKKHSIVNEESQKFFQEQERMNQLLKELGEQKGGLEAIIEKLKNESNDLEIKKAKSEVQLDEIRINIEGIEAPKKEDLVDANFPELKKRVNQLEKELGAIEGVNLRAVDMYEELEKQYAEIKERNEHLYIEKEKIYDLIEIIEEKKKAVFYDSFYKVKEQFEQIISELYPGTDGFLKLENENDPFNSGLILEVRPRGREGMNIDSLSGGEKTLTAIAFLMATQSANPSPFYILDEVDAALDQENVLRLVQFLKNRKQSQFIMISHNPETVKHMDSVVGVHMQNGLSRIVGVNMEMVEA